MFKYGNMLAPKDILDFSFQGIEQACEVKDRWPSRYTAAHSWVELWTIDQPDTVPRLLGIVLVPDFSQWQTQGSTAMKPTLHISESRSVYAPPSELDQHGLMKADWRI